MKSVYLLLLLSVVIAGCTLEREASKNKKDAQDGNDESSDSGTATVDSQLKSYCENGKNKYSGTIDAVEMNDFFGSEEFPFTVQFEYSYGLDKVCYDYQEDITVYDLFKVKELTSKMNCGEDEISICKSEGVNRVCFRISQFTCLNTQICSKETSECVEFEVPRVETDFDMLTDWFGVTFTNCKAINSYPCREFPECEDENDDYKCCHNREYLEPGEYTLKVSARIYDVEFYCGDLYNYIGFVEGGEYKAATYDLPDIDFMVLPEE